MAYGLKACSCHPLKKETKNVVHQVRFWILPYINNESLHIALKASPKKKDVIKSPSPAGKTASNSTAAGRGATRVLSGRGAARTSAGRGRGIKPSGRGRGTVMSPVKPRIMRASPGKNASSDKSGSQGRRLIKVVVKAKWSCCVWD